MMLHNSTWHDIGFSYGKGLRVHTLGYNNSLPKHALVLHRVLFSDLKLDCYMRNIANPD